MVIALIVNGEGFPLSYETLDGDRRDVTTLEVLMRMVERKYGKARRVWVFDRGIVSEANLEALRWRGGQYLVGTPRSKLKEFEQALLEGDWKQIQKEVELKLVSLPDTTETYVLCRSSSRREKEKAIRQRFSQRLEQGLGRLHQRIAQGRLKDPTKIQQALARLRVQHSRVADLYQMSLAEHEGTLQLEWQRREERLAWREAREGAYLLRTNLTGESAEELWKKYIQLTEAEAAFRVLKSTLWIRPFFHQLERRIKAHILVAFLGYALWVTLKHLLHRKDSGWSPAQALALFSTLHSADIVLPTTDGREIRLRRVSAPDPQQQQLLDQLGLTVPHDLELNFECSVDSALT